jgi:tetratricopeptide (TPR) repeat protein
VDDAIAQFLKSDSLENAYYKREKIKPDFDWHHAHNLDLLAGCYQHKGQMKLAEKTLRASAKLDVVSAYRAFNLRELPNFLIHRGRYKEALEAGRGLTKTKYPQGRTVGHALAGEALLWLGRVDEAKKELQAAERELGQVPLVALGLDPRRSMVEPWVEALRGELLLREGRMEEGRAVLKRVVQKLRASPGPDAWTQALFRLEVLGRIAREAGDWELAEHIAEQMLEHDEAYGGSHMARALVFERKGDLVHTVQERERAKVCWSQADRDLRELRQLEKIGPPRQEVRAEDLRW